MIHVEAVLLGDYLDEGVELDGAHLIGADPLQEGLQPVNKLEVGEHVEPGAGVADFDFRGPADFLVGGEELLEAGKAALELPQLQLQARSQDRGVPEIVIKQLFFENLKFLLFKDEDLEQLLLVKNVFVLHYGYFEVAQDLLDFDVVFFCQVEPVEELDNIFYFLNLLIHYLN